MELFRQVEDKIKDIFSTRNSAAHFATKTLFAMFLARTVNMSIIASCIQGKAKNLSKYKRIQRMLSSLCASEDRIAYFIMSMLLVDKEKILLIMDRTNWKIGKFDVSILFLAISFNGIAFPILFSLLENNGGSCSSNDKIGTVERFIRLFGTERIEAILCAGEFCTKEFFNELDVRLKIKYTIRIKNNSIIENTSGGNSPAKIFFACIKKNSSKTLKGKRKILGRHLTISGSKSYSGELLIVASNCSSENLLDLYKKRWQIETMFKYFKSCGFNLEAAAVKSIDRLRNLLFFLEIAFCLAMSAGLFGQAQQLEEQESRPAKRSDPAKPKKIRRSVFRIGFDLVARLACGLAVFSDHVHDFFNSFNGLSVLSCT